MSLSLNLESIILLLFFIAPGFVFTRTYTPYRPRYYRSPDPFGQFVLAIIGSVIIHATLLFGVALGLIGYWMVGGPIYSLAILIGPPMPIGSYPLPVLAVLIVVNILYLALSLVLARRFATFLGLRRAPERPRWWNLTLGQDPPEPLLLWHTILQVEPLSLNLIPPYLTIQMRNGEYFEGNLYSMRLVGDEMNTVELALRNAWHRATPPESFDRSNRAASDLEPLSNQIVLLKSTDILWLARNDIPR